MSNSFGNSYIFNLCVVSECVITDCCYGYTLNRIKHLIFSCFTVILSKDCCIIVKDHIQSFVNRNELLRIQIIRCFTAIPVRSCCRQCFRFKRNYSLRTTIECVCIDLSYSFGNHYTKKIAAVVEGVRAYRFTIRIIFKLHERNLGKIRRAVWTEQVCRDSCNLITNCNNYTASIYTCIIEYIVIACKIIHRNSIEFNLTY